MTLKPSIPLALKVACAAAILIALDIMVIDYYIAPKKTGPTPEVQDVAITSQEAASLAAGLQNMNKQAVMRDTVLLQQLLKTQHKLGMHSQKTPMCPECYSRANTEYRITKDGPL
tara:strand:- start:150 stop:494 length:345 start_codon:yes stop_codon:yes gene_type:complete